MTLTESVLEDEGMHVFEWWGSEYRPLADLIAEMDDVKRKSKQTNMNLSIGKTSNLSAYLPQGIYTFISVLSLNVNRTSSLLKTVTKSIRLYHWSSSNSVTTPSCRSSPSRNLSICSFFACLPALATASWEAYSSAILFLHPQRISVHYHTRIVR